MPARRPPGTRVRVRDYTGRVRVRVGVRVRVSSVQKANRACKGASAKFSWGSSVISMRLRYG